ncbi:MAG: glutathione-dependent formaldehyde dehydrogenase [Proteobacteria bacterium]|nr:MAG: glutathione-dependent formaldehyde dehydrogenase [Pseudomonadota bacterium]
MKALTWQAPRKMKVLNVPDPRIIDAGDIVIKTTASAICGSDLHLYGGFVPAMAKGDIMGHEFMGEIMEVGKNIRNLKVGDKVVVPFTIACGKCHHCEVKEHSLCDNTNPNAAMAEAANGANTAGLFGFSQLYGGYAGGQAEYVRVPYADVGCLKVPKDIEDEKVLFLSDIFPTGYMAADNCNIKRGDTVAVWGCGPVGLFAIKSAYLLGAEKVIAIDRFPERLEMAAKHCGADVINYEELDVIDELKKRTGGRGPDACIDAVGMEAHGTGLQYTYDKTKTMLMMETDRPIALRQAMIACRKGGTISIPGVYAGVLDKMPFGAAFAKGLTLKMGQTHMQKYMPPLLDLILNDKIDTTFLITHRIKLDEAADAYEMWQKKKDACVKFVIKN